MTTSALTPFVLSAAHHVSHLKTLKVVLTVSGATLSFIGLRHTGSYSRLIDDVSGVACIGPSLRRSLSTMHTAQ